MKVGTGLAQGRHATCALVTQAVSEAMHRAGLEVASSVLLFLSRDFAGDPQPAIRAAATAANTLQVSGCSSYGIFTEKDWVIDTPAAAAMVFGDGVAARSARHGDSLRLTLTAPHALNTSWMQLSGECFGAVAGDATGQGKFSVWENGRNVLHGYCDLNLQGVDGIAIAAHGIKQLGIAQRVDKVSGHELMMLSNQPALLGLRNALGAEGMEPDAAIPYHRLMVMFAEDEVALLRGDGQWASIIGVNDDAHSVVLAKLVSTGCWLAWGLLDAETAQHNLLAKVRDATVKLSSPPAFGLMFSCLARGPQFYNGMDRDIQLLKRHCPGMPVIGFYGNGEIAPINNRNELLQHSVVIGLFAAEG